MCTMFLFYPFLLYYLRFVLSLWQTKKRDDERMYCGWCPPELHQGSTVDPCH